MNWMTTIENDFGLQSTENQEIPLQGVSVTGRIMGRGIKMTVAQTYRNSEQKPVEAVYKFPLPDESAVCGFRLIRSGSTLTAAMLEREEAFKCYDEALEKADKAYLLDQERPNIFTMSIGNLAPHELLTIEIDIAGLLSTNGTQVQFRFPSTITPRYTPAGAVEPGGMPTDAAVNPPVTLSVHYGLMIHLTLEDAENISVIESPSHAIRYLKRDGVASVELAADSAQMDSDFILNIGYKEELVTRAYSSSDDDGTYIQVDYMHVDVTKENDDTGSREVVFVLDCSGSMKGVSIEQAKRALDILLRALPQGISFNVYLFGTRFEKFFPSPRPAEGDAIKSALEKLKTVDAGMGGTEVMLPLQDIYSKPEPKGSRDIILLTDGAIGNESEVMNLAIGHLSSSRLSVIGIGHGPNEFMVRQVSKKGGGAYDLIDPGERIEPKVLRLVTKLLAGRPARIQLCVKAEAECAPQEATVFGGEAISLFARLRKSSQPCSSITININGKDISLPVTDGTDESTPIATLWARQMIIQLEDLDYAGGSRQFDRKVSSDQSRVLELAKKYSLMSSQSSFLLIETVPDTEKNGQSIELRRVPVMLARGRISAHGLWAKGYRPIGTCDRILSCSPSQESVACSEFDAANEDAFSATPRFKRIKRLIGTIIGSEKPALNNEGLIFRILGTQLPEGGFEFAEDIMAHILPNKAREDINALASRIVTAADVDKNRLLWSVIILRLLEHRYTSYRSLWEPLVRKSQAWTQQQLQRTKAHIDQEMLEDYVLRAFCGSVHN